MVHRPLLIRGAEVFDGLGSAPIAADVLVQDGRIRLLEPAAAANATCPDEVELIDGGGLALSPGFIDVHTHSDALALLPAAAADLALAPVRQGVTVEIAGNCGGSLFPGLVEPAAAPSMQAFMQTLFGGDVPSVADMPAFVRLHTAAPRRTHITTLVGHSVLRAAVLGFEDRAPRPAELDRMCELLDAALAAGAAGLSSGLIYPPGAYAQTDELVTLARVVAARDRLYVTHLRDEMSRVEQALDEALDIARRSGVALHVSHHKTAGRHGWGLSTRTLATMDAARNEGVDLTCDVYPYTAASTHLHAMFPPWANAGGIPALLERLGSGPALREQIKRSITEGAPGWENTVGNGGWDLIEIATAAGHREAEGRPVSELAAAAGQHPVDYAADLLLAERARVTVISRSMAEEDVRRVLTHSGTMIGSDGVPRSGRSHPRWAGSFARVLGRYSRETGLLPLAEAITRMTSIPARRFGLLGRGIIADGAYADLVLFDPATVADRATFSSPLLPPVGVSHVIVAGIPVIAAGRPTDAHPGRVLIAERGARRR